MQLNEDAKDLKKILSKSISESTFNSFSDLLVVIQNSSAPSYRKGEAKPRTEGKL